MNRVPVTLHLVPAEDGQHELDHDGECPCQPELRPTRRHSYFRHQPLGVRSSFNPIEEAISA